MSTVSKKSLVQPYLMFNGRCDEALDFYKKALGAEVLMLMRFKDSPELPPPGCAPSPADKVMHTSFRIGETVLMASDGQCEGEPKFEGISLSLTVPTEAEAEKYFGTLANSGQVVMPLAKTFFSAKFGMVNDKFGLNWMVLVTPNV